MGVSIGDNFRRLFDEMEKEHEIEVFYMPAYGYSPLSLLHDLWFTFKHRNKHGINHVTGECHFIILALLGCKTVLTVHDLQTILKGNGHRSKFVQWVNYYLQIYWPIKLATEVVAITQKTRQEILETVPYKRVIKVAHHVSIDNFKYSPKALNKRDVNILANGTAPRKNLETIIRAVALLDNCRLTVIRKMTESQIELCQSLNVSYANKYDLSSEELINEYINCDIVCFPTLYEGFGAIIVEGQSIGRPVITTNDEPMKSVAGVNGALLLDNPTNVDELVGALKKIINDDDYREQLVKKGYHNSRRFLVANCVKEYDEIYKAAMQS